MRRNLYNPLERQPSPNSFKKHRISTWRLFLSWGQCFGVNSSYQLCTVMDCGQLLFLPARHLAAFFSGISTSISTWEITQWPSHAGLAGPVLDLPRSGNKSQTTMLLFFPPGNVIIEWSHTIKRKDQSAFIQGSKKFSVYPAVGDSFCSY